MARKDVIVPGCCDDLEACLAMPFHCIPNFEYRVANLELPLSGEDLRLLTTDPINLFTADPAVQPNNVKYASSTPFAKDDFRFVGDFVIHGICLFVAAEGMGAHIDGNVAYDQANVNDLFASPDVLRTDPVKLAQLGLAQGVNIRGCDLEYGTPAWRFAEKFMQAFKLRMYCPNSNQAFILDEPLSEIGNCCGNTEYIGLSSVQHGVTLIERSVNDRLEAVQADLPGPWNSPGGLPGVAALADAGRFLAVNSTQGAALIGQEADLIPTRYGGTPVAFSRVKGNPNVQYWYKFAAPLPVSNSTSIRVEFTQDPGGVSYLADAIKAASMQLIDAFDGAGNDYPTYEEQETQAAFGQRFYLPHGRIRIGIGFKGVKVAPNVCQALAQRYMGGTGQMTASVIQGLCGKAACGC